MKIGMIGLGKMGFSLTENLLEQGVEVVAYDVDASAVQAAGKKGAQGVDSLEQMMEQLPAEQKIIWLMVPAGEITEKMVQKLSDLLKKDDMLIDGGNSFYEDSVRRGKALADKGIYFFDVGTSGGVDGARYGGNFMIGGDQAAFSIIEPLFEKIAQAGGYLYTGASGSGHYLKMVHNGIEYGMMQAIAEGFDVLEHSQFHYDNQAVADLWNHGSVVRSWLMELAAEAFKEDPHLDELKGTMYSSGEGRWTVEEALKLQVPTPVISLSLMMRYRSLESDTFTGKVVAALRNGFGGHAVDKNRE